MLIWFSRNRPRRHHTRNFTLNGGFSVLGMSPNPVLSRFRCGWHKLQLSKWRRCGNALSVAKTAGRVATNAVTWLVDGILDSVVTERHRVEVGRAGPFVIAADANQPEVLYKPVEHIFDVHLFLPPTVRPTCGASTDTWTQRSPWIKNPSRTSDAHWDGTVQPGQYVSWCGGEGWWTEQGG